METQVGVKKGVLVRFNQEQMNVSIGVIDIDIEEKSNAKRFCEIIGADLIDVAEYDENIDIVVDDESLLVAGNPAYDIKTPYGNIQLAGNLLFLKKEFGEDGIDLVGMESGEVFDLLVQLQGNIKIIGMTKGI